SSKFGIEPADLDRAAALARACGARVVGLHAHAGSGILEPEAWAELARFLLDAMARFPDARVLDLGGGFGVPRRPGGRGLDLGAVGERLAEALRGAPDREVWLEPGRFLVAEAGVLLTTVTQL